MQGRSRCCAETTDRPSFASSAATALGSGESKQTEKPSLKSAHSKKVPPPVTDVDFAAVDRGFAFAALASVELPRLPQPGRGNPVVSGPLPPKPKTSVSIECVSTVGGV